MLHIDLWQTRQLITSLHRMHLWKQAEADAWLLARRTNWKNTSNGQSQSHGDVIKTSRERQRMAGGRPKAAASSWEFLVKETEEVLSRVLNMEIQGGLEERVNIAVHRLSSPPVFVFQSLSLSLSLTHTPLQSSSDPNEK